LRCEVVGLQGERAEAWRAVRFCAALRPVVHEGANGGSQQGESGDAIRRRLHGLLPRSAGTAGTEQGSQMQALAQLCEDQTHTEWSQGSPCRLASRVRYRPSSSNLFQRRNRFIHARHTAARARSKIEGGAGGEGQISRLGLGTAGGDGLRGGSREVAMFAGGRDVNNNEMQGTSSNAGRGRERRKFWVRPRACASADGWHFTCVGGRIDFEMKRFSRVQGAA
jgi:hypothetical protein